MLILKEQKCLGWELDISQSLFSRIENNRGKQIKFIFLQRQGSMLKIKLRVVASSQKFEENRQSVKK